MTAHLKVGIDDPRKCIACGVVKPADQFYKRSATLRRRLCKSCWIGKTNQWAAANREKSNAIKRAHSHRTEHKAKKEWAKRNELKCAAHRAVHLAVMSGSLQSEPCEVCGADNAHAHHDDYSKPLAVRWLCPAHHKQWHAQQAKETNQISFQGRPIRKGDDKYAHPNP